MNPIHEYFNICVVVFFAMPFAFPVALAVKKVFVGDVA